MASNYEGKRLNSFNCHILIEQKLTYNTCEISSTASLTFKLHFTKVGHEGQWHVMRKVNMEEGLDWTVHFSRSSHHALPMRYGKKNTGKLMNTWGKLF